MSTTEHETAAPEQVELHPPGEHEHPDDRRYVEIAIILGILTALEVATYFFDDTLGDALIPSLMVLMVIKFFMVAAWFMHLKFDTRLFTRMFLGGLVLAAGVYLVMLTMFEFWQDG